MTKFELKELRKRKTEELKKRKVALIMGLAAENARRPSFLAYGKKPTGFSYLTRKVI